MGTYVPDTDHPGKSATDCRACPYGKGNSTFTLRVHCIYMHHYIYLGIISLAPEKTEFRYNLMESLNSDDYFLFPFSFL